MQNVSFSVRTWELEDKDTPALERTMGNDAYREAGVDIDAADALIDRIRPLAAATRRPEVLDSIGGFGALFHLGNRYKDPVLVSGTDGVGTKLLLAQKFEQHSTIGIDLVAMCVNDILVLGAEPLFFLDYFATGKLQQDVAAEVIAGIAEGCRQGGCALVGGETAEMPGMYGPGHYDLAGFAVGVVERADIINGSGVNPGDKIVGIPSTGLHSNGYSLVRKILSDSGISNVDDTPAGFEHSLKQTLLQPTQIYVDQIRTIQEHGRIKAMAHITGGGLPGNMGRTLPDGMSAIIHTDTWTPPPIFSFLQTIGGISNEDMFRTFNYGIGMAIVVSQEFAKQAANLCNGNIIGEVQPGSGVHLQ